jgi:predicted transcriptional regulator
MDKVRCKEAIMLKEEGISETRICEMLGIKKEVLSAWMNKPKRESKHREQTEERAAEITDTVSRLGCATIQEISEESGLSVRYVQKAIPEIVRKGKLEKIALAIGKKSRHYFRSRDLFGEYAGSMLFYMDRKAMFTKLVEIIPNPAEKGLKSSLTRYLRNFGLKREEIEKLYRVKDSKNSIVNVQLKSGESFLLDSFGLTKETDDKEETKPTNDIWPGLFFSFLS